MQNEEEDALLRKMLQVVPWYSCKGKEWMWFVDMNRRLIRPQESNFAHWDAMEKDELDRFLHRCTQLKNEEFLKGTHFHVNWENLKIAEDYWYKLRAEHEPMPMQPTFPKRRFPVGEDPFYDNRQNEERPLKRAIKEGWTVNPWGSFVGTPDLPALIGSCKAVLEDIDKTMHISDESKPPFKMTVSEYLRSKRTPGLFRLALEKYKETDRLELELDD